jgi:TonB family protein
MNPFDLLGQSEKCSVCVIFRGHIQPKLEIPWNSFHQNFFTGLPVLFQSMRLPKDAPGTDVFRDCRVERRIPRRAILAAALLHVAFLLLPWPELPAASKQNSAFENTQLTWSGPIEDLPLLNVPRPRAKPAPLGKPDKPDPSAGADAYHPRQRIYTDPVHPTHPRQTLINPAAPPLAPKFLPELPNIVELASAPAPARPRMQISQQALQNLRPRGAKRVATTDTPAPDMPNMEQRPADISLAVAQNAPAKPKLEINAGSAPLLAGRTQEGEVAAAAPDVAPAASGTSNGSSGTLIALSATPAPPAPVVAIPQGNLAARVAISPEGKQPGVPNGSPHETAGVGGGSDDGGDSSGGGHASVGVTISGGNPKPNATMSGLGGSGKYNLSKSSGALKRPDPKATIEDPPDRIGPPNFAALPPGAKPEQIFASRRVYSMNVNMPNLSSATGSWIIHFSELHLGDAGHLGEVSAPIPVRKVDPKYPQTLVQDHVQGEVILYGVIRQDGSVDSIQLVRGIDEQLDGNAVRAFSQWKFEPATKEGRPVDLEAIVYIPFRTPERR